MESAADGLTWRKASHSGNNGGNCVEVGPALASIAVRDSKDPNGPRLAFTSEDWREFTDQIKEARLP